MRSHLHLTGLFSCYDPVMGREEEAVAAHLHLHILPVNEEAKRTVHRPTIFAMFHCPPSLYNRLIWANLTSSQPRPISSAEADDEQLTREMEQLQLSGTESEALQALMALPLRHVVVVGNSFSSILSRPAFHSREPRASPSSSSALGPRGSRSKRTSASSAMASPRCPLHSGVYSQPPLSTLLSPLSQQSDPANVSPSSASPPSPECRTRGQCDYLCLVSELGLLHVDELSEAIEQSESDIATAFHGTAVQWFASPQCGTQGGDEKREEIGSWLQQLVEPIGGDAEDVEIVLTQHTHPAADDPQDMLSRADWRGHRAQSDVC